MSEETKRTILTASAMIAWLVALVLAAFMAGGKISHTWGPAVTVLVGAAVTLTIIRVSLRTQQTLAGVFMAGVEAERRREHDALPVEEQITTA